MFYLAREVGKFGHVLAKKKVTLQWLMNSNMVKPEKFDHLHLVYHFTIPLTDGLIKRTSSMLNEIESKTVQRRGWWLIEEKEVKHQVK